MSWRIFQWLCWRAEKANNTEQNDRMENDSMADKRTSHPQLQADPVWYKDAIIYEIHIRAFSDSNGDGIGDFPGLTQKLDYLQDLGVTAVWLLPFCPSPLKDDGYDIQDYTSVHASYGTLRDVEIFPPVQVA